MDSFKQLPKMQCFREGGSVQKKIANYEKRERKTEEKADLNKDKAIVKKAIKMHDVQEHGGETTNLSKLRNGGRAKKEVGTVKKYEKASGEYSAKKDTADKKRIKEAKQFKPSKMCGGGMAKYAPGGSVDVKDPKALTDKIATEENLEDREMVMKPLRALKDIAVKGYNKITGQGAVTDKERKILEKKCGGKVTKK